ncbi:hypothetical protein COCCADRAFT_38009 [Bipolaris zeicola 26-R-13]|uniref:Protein kinase domain-containing protein n=1 Tax=Cochliobolus carbonum (strain 26-R-13) TaxID=930089 RepID=W6YKU4_COCC2|nr:uncharacterized protein COCCADRAFT_38009 [Bipolaris zeicola 26-R-13]EUC31986.1 hypothetical protein COCCADRAFT_38009 [Bipolaris zeicola 26-R-13]
MSSLFWICQFLKGHASKYTIYERNLRYYVVCAQRTPYLRPLIDEINEPSVPITIILERLQGDLLEGSATKTLNRRELKYVSRCVFEAINILHEDGFVHAGTTLISMSHGTLPLTYGHSLISPIYGGRLNLFRPKGMKQDNEEYSSKIAEIAHIEAALSILYLVQTIAQKKKTSFIQVTEKEVTKRDNIFISKMMKLDWRDPPTAKELLEDDWWKNDDE